jgi:methenyltetrahydromethanopterin cyclohydrolase
MSGFSLNESAGRLADEVIRDAAMLRLEVTTGPGGATLIDCSVGGVAAGLRMAAICLGGLGAVGLTQSDRLPRWPWQVSVYTSDPVIACLASQYAGWRLSSGAGKEKFFALGSGPARALARKEPLFDELPHREAAARAVLLLETECPPPGDIVEKVARDCRIAPERVTILFAPLQSLAGTVQVVARVVEVALHKAHALKFPFDRIVDAMGSAPLAPPHPELAKAMGRSNDAIILGGRVHLFVSGSTEEARALAEALPSSTSRDYGTPFAETFRRVGGDFYAIDPLLFSPAEVAVTAIETGETFRAGSLAPELIDASFG